MIKYIKSITLSAVVAFGITSCVGDLDKMPVDPNETTPDVVYADPTAYKGVLAKCYAGLALSGQVGPDGKPDITGIDEGFSTYIRQYFKAQELTTDEAICAWNDGNLRDYHDQDWTPSNEFITAMYNRIYYQITLVNEYLREATDAKLESRGQSEYKAEVSEYRAEARWLRALSYFHALDLYGSVPFVDHNDPVGSFMPPQITRADLYAWIETELLEAVEDLKAPQANEYGRVDKAAAWMLLSRLYLNAEVYIGEAHYTEAAEYAKKVIDEGGYQLATNYAELFMADNGENQAASEIIFPVNFDGQHSQTWGGMTYLIAAQIGGDMSVADYGTTQGWGGNRTTPELVDKFDDVNGDTDSRAMFHTEGQEKEIADIYNFKHGYAIRKWTNKTSTGEDGSNGTFMDADFPMFRLAEAYLTYAECATRGAGDRSVALNYINTLRERAYGDESGNIAAGELNTEFIIEERAREFYWECHRRTDLIRFGMFSDTDYTWAWKGSNKGGSSTDSKYDVFPLPSSDVGANTNLTQNPNY